MAEMEAQTQEPITYKREKVLAQEDVLKIVGCFKKNPETYNKWDVIYSALNLSPGLLKQWKTQHFAGFTSDHTLFTDIVQTWISQTDSTKRTVGNLVDILDQIDLKLTAEYIREDYNVLR